MPNFSIFSILPEDNLSHQAIIRIVGDNPDCTEGLLMENFNGGTPTETLSRIKELRANLIDRGYLTIDQYRQNHTLTFKGKRAYSLLGKNDDSRGWTPSGL